LWYILLYKYNIYFILFRETKIKMSGGYYLIIQTPFIFSSLTQAKLFGGYYLKILRFSNTTTKRWKKNVGP